jgi:hypothetical protein
LKEIPITGFVAGKRGNDIFDFGGAVISGEMDSAVVEIDAVKLTFSIIIIEVIGDVIASKNVEGPRLPRVRHQGG